ncbi:AbrB/MazE/SpoVT family DNA-binding domain-containing protein [Candidatus Woesearchaeota archaeon]|nr:AbrB/MazE/SpoVT family DNA-binding domain-containing protein [Candidatus Woesearchaeota archaeon]
MTAQTIVTRGSQITIAKAIREKMNVKEGDRLILNLMGDVLIVSKRDPSVFDKFEHFLPENFDELLKKTRADSKERLRRLGAIR